MSFRRHYYRRHFQTTSSETVDNDFILPDCSTSEDDCSEIHNAETNKCDEAAFLLKLTAGHRLSQNAVADIMVATKELFRSKFICFQQAQHNVDNSSEHFPTILVDSMFSGLDSTHLRNKFFEERLGYVKPVPVQLGILRRNLRCGSKYVIRNIAAHGYVVPFLKQLVQLLAMPEVHQCLNYFPSHGSDGSHLMYDIDHGLNMRADSYFLSHPKALRFALYTDEFEVVNPIGSHKKIHKQTAFYWTLLNIPAEYRSKLRVIQLCAIAKSVHVKHFGLSQLLKDFSEGLNAVFHGVNLDIPRYGIEHYCGKLHIVVADTLAAHSLGGFKEGVGSAKSPCRTCEITREDLCSVHFASDCQLRNEVEHRDRCEALSSITMQAKQFWSKQWGINGATVLMSIPDFQITRALLHDPMHDILEGVARYEIRAMLNLFILVHKLFTLEQFNNRLQNFEYDYTERQDRPQLLDRKCLEPGSTLNQSAASMKNLMILLPCLIGDKVPLGDRHWKNFIRLLQITLLSLSPVVSDRTAQSLEMLIAVHNSEYCQLYGDDSLKPKMHYLLHYPDQLLNYGPIRNHWCMRYESKNGFFKQKRWHNFRNIPLSLATFHQQWMCLQMLGTAGSRNQCYLYDGDDVQEGISVNSETIPLLNELVAPCTALQTKLVSICGHRYSPGTVMLVELDQPLFAEIESIFVVNNEKFVECHKLAVLAFHEHLNMFSVKRSGELCVLKVINLKYSWPQISHKINGEHLVMLVHCDDMWSL